MSWDANWILTSQASDATEKPVPLPFPRPNL
jgi:hypothetical protein